MAASAAYLQPATYNYLVSPMLVTFGAAQNMAGPLRETPSIASLLVIFLAAVLARRFGERRVLAGGALLLIAGSLVMVISPTLIVAVAGLALETVGGTILLVVPLGVIAAVVDSDEGRARGFALFSMVSPLVFVALPVLAAWFMQAASWRVVAGLWAVGGLAALIAARSAVETPPVDSELVSPALAGLLAVGVVQIVSHLSSGPVLSVGSAVRVGITIAAGIGLALALRRPNSLDVGLLRRPAFALMLVVVGLWCFTQLWYYMTLAFEYVYGRSVLQTALLMVPAQVCAALGARTSGWLVVRFGLTRTAVWLLAVTGVSLASSVTITVDSPLWWPVVVTCLYSFASVAAGVPMTKALMDEATPGDESGASAYRQAAIAVGTAVGIALISTLVFAAFNASLTSRLQAQDLDTAQARQIAVDMRTGLTEQQESAAYAVPLAEVQAVNEDQQEAFLDGTAVHGWAGALLSALTAWLFWFSRRGLEDQSARVPRSRQRRRQG